MLPLVIEDMDDDPKLLIPWLKQCLDNKTYRRLRWMNKSKETFQVPWKHRASKKWDFSDIEVAIGWAKHKGSYNENKPNFNRLKSNFRSALNCKKNKELIQLPEQKSKMYRVWKFISPDMKNVKKGRKPRVKKVKNSESKAAKVALAEKDTEKQSESLPSPSPQTSTNGIELFTFAEEKNDQLLPSFELLFCNISQTLPQRCPDLATLSSDAICKDSATENHYSQSQSPGLKEVILSNQPMTYSFDGQYSSYFGPFPSYQCESVQCSPGSELDQNPLLLDDVTLLHDYIFV